MTAEHSNDKWVAFAWPQRIAQQCEDTSGLLKQGRGLFLEEVRRGDLSLRRPLRYICIALTQRNSTLGSREEGATDHNAISRAGPLLAWQSLWCLCCPTSLGRTVYTLGRVHHKAWDCLEPGCDQETCLTHKRPSSIPSEYRCSARVRIFILLSIPRSCSKCIQLDTR